MEEKIKAAIAMKETAIKYYEGVLAGAKDNAKKCMESDNDANIIMFMNGHIQQMKEASDQIKIISQEVRELNFLLND